MKEARRQVRAFQSGCDLRDHFPLDVSEMQLDSVEIHLFNTRFSGFPAQKCMSDFHGLAAVQ